MRHPFFSSPRPLVFAHRGGGALAPENTIVAFDHGLALGADGLELDVHLSCDGQVVVHHDRTVDRTTSLQGPVERYTADELARATPSAACLPGQGIGVPTLRLVRAIATTRIVIEMKVNSARLAQACVQAIRAADAVERVCLAAFGLRVLRAARALEPALATGAAREEVRWALYRSRCRWPVSRVKYAGYQVPEISGRTRVVSSRFVGDAHAAGLGVHVWTVDTEPDARRLLEWGVNGLMTDRPDLVVPVCRPTS